MVEARRERKAAVDRHEPVSGLEADDAATGRGDSDRAGRVRAERRVRQPQRERRGGPSAGTARRPAGRARIRDGAVVRVLGRHPVRKLVQVRLADIHVAGVFEQPHRFGGLRGNVVGENRRAVRRSQPGRVE